MIDPDFINLFHCAQYVSGSIVIVMALLRFLFGTLRLGFILELLLALQIISRFFVYANRQRNSSRLLEQTAQTSASLLRRDGSRKRKTFAPQQKFSLLTSGTSTQTPRSRMAFFGFASCVLWIRLHCFPCPSVSLSLVFSASTCFRRQLGDTITVTIVLLL